MYTCAECQRAVVVTPEGEIIRACAHKEAKVIASVSATVYGIAKLRQMTPEERAQRGL